MLKVSNVQILKSQSPFERLLELDFVIQPGEILTLMGPSGSGKSTFLNYLLGHLPSAFTASGKIELNGIDISEQRPHLREIGVLYQNGLLFDHLSVFENIALGMREGQSKSERQQTISLLLEKVGLADSATSMPNTLSGGEYIRVALLRTLAAKPKALLLDEPFSRLDAKRRVSVRSWVFEYALLHQIPVLLVTHDEQDAIEAGSRIIDLESSFGYDKP